MNQQWVNDQRSNIKAAMDLLCLDYTTKNHGEHDSEIVIRLLAVIAESLVYSQEQEKQDEPA
jgi:hypothetical protein